MEVIVLESSEEKSEGKPEDWRMDEELDEC